ncbi:unnamed protein product [Phytomonas sp. EM1]|nr:unnamed protein product [Phytomonas sp. EM1]|eukprot:CCW62898.1 unnamed protein product [Phytomonas sp. isolate EM1]
MKSIAVVGANPALQKILRFETLTIDEVNRATAMQLTTGGKGTNFCRASRHHGRAAAVLFTFLGGSNGTRVGQLLEEEGLPFRAVRVSAETRECTTCLLARSDAMTELIGPSHPIPPAAAAEMLAGITAALEPAGGIDGLAIMGSLPDGTDPDLYTEWTRAALAAGRPVLLDAVKGVEPALRLPGSRHAILKVNMEEFRKLTAPAADLAGAFHHAMREWTVEVVAVTNGPGLAYLQVRGEPLRVFRVPKLTNVVNPIGSGDTAAAVFFAEYLNGVGVVEAFRRGLVAASANCLQIDAGVFDQADYDRLFDSVTVAEASEPLQA